MRGLGIVTASLYSFVTGVYLSTGVNLIMDILKNTH